MRKWILPERVEDVLPAEAERIEALRRLLLDHFRAHGYRLVQPPLVEHLDSLLTGTGRDLDLQTFKVVDPMSGRLLGVRADITPQVARIDAHLLNEPGVTRLCYAGSVLRTTAGIGADARGRADRRRALRRGRHRRRHRGDHAAPVLARRRGRRRPAPRPRARRRLSRARGRRRHGANGEDSELFDALRAKDLPSVAALTAKLPAAWRDALVALPSLYGPARDVLATARERLPDIPAIRNALDALAALAEAGAPRVDALHIDLADLRGYHYHSGAIFSAYTAGQAAAIGNGGRYDGIGKAFGRARPATGFTLDLRQLAGLPGTTTRS